MEGDAGEGGRGTDGRRHGSPFIAKDLSLYQVDLQSPTAQEKFPRKGFPDSWMSPSSGGWGAGH